jgi:iron complex outermembrane receptor protein
MTRPYANTVTPSDLFQVIGTQRNYGVEFFAQGDVTPGLSVLGGATYIDARLLNTGVAGTDGGLVVGVPNWKSDVTLDYHPVFLHGFALTGTAHYESERAATNVKNQSFAASYATLDLGVRYAAKIYQRYLTVRVGAINITDTRYYSSVADGTIVGSPGANTAYLGAPRTVLASIEVDL